MAFLAFFKSLNPFAWALIALMIVSGLFFGYFKYSQYKFEVYQSEISSLKVSNDALKNQVDTMKVDFAKIRDINNTLVAQERENNKALEDLRVKLNKLEGATAGKPGLVEKIVNKASDERNRCFALATGAKPLKNEKNRVCPNLLK